MQKVRFGKETNAHLQGPKNPDSLLKEIQKKGIPLLKVEHVTYFLFRFVDYPLQDLDMKKYIINP